VGHFPQNERTLAYVYAAPMRSHQPLMCLRVTLSRISLPLSLSLSLSLSPSLSLSLSLSLWCIPCLKLLVVVPVARPAAYEANARTQCQLALPIPVHTLLASVTFRPKGAPSSDACVCVRVPVFVCRCAGSMVVLNVLCGRI
jgi:hypothetical protein